MPWHIYGLSSIVGLLAGGYFSDRWSKKTRAPGLSFYIGLMFAILAILLGSTTTVLAITVAAFAVYADKQVSDTNMMPMLCLTIDHRYRATGYGY